MYMNMKDYTTLPSDTDWSKRTWETIQHYIQTLIEVKQQLVIRKNMDVYEHERLYNITFRNRLKQRNMRDYTTLHSDTDWSNGTACNKKEYGCIWTWKTIKHYTQKQIEVKEHERLYNITLRHILK